MVEGLTLDGAGQLAIIFTAFLAGCATVGAILRGLKNWLTKDTASSAEVKQVVKDEVRTQLAPIAAQVGDLTVMLTSNGGDTDYPGDRLLRLEDTMTEVLDIVRPKPEPVKRAPAKKAAAAKRARAR